MGYFHLSEAVTSLVRFRQLVPSRSTTFTEGWFVLDTNPTL